MTECVFCTPSEPLGVTQVWEDDRWRLLADLGAEVLGFSLLVPKRHVPHITDLDGEEARTFGEVLAMTTSALREETEPAISLFLFRPCVELAEFTGLD